MHLKRILLNFSSFLKFIFKKFPYRNFNSFNLHLLLNQNEILVKIIIKEYFIGPEEFCRQVFLRHLDTFWNEWYLFDYVNNWWFIPQTDVKRRIKEAFKLDTNIQRTIDRLFAQLFPETIFHLFIPKYGWTKIVYIYFYLQES